jgi:hypothetical protein
MHKNKFSIVEIAVVLFVILLLMSIAAAFYKTVQNSIMHKNQTLEFENFKIAINAYKSSIRGAGRGSEKHVNLFDLIHKHSIMTEKRLLLFKKVPTPVVYTELKEIYDLKAPILTYFGTPIEVYVTKQKIGAKEVDIDKGLKNQIVGHEYLTGEFEFYFGRDHEVDGGEAPPAPGSTPFGLKGTGNAEDANQYFYRFVYYDNIEKDGPPHEYLMH